MPDPIRVLLVDDHMVVRIGLRALIDSVRRRPARALTRWRVSNSWRSRLRSSGQVDVFSVGGGKVVNLQNEGKLDGKVEVWQPGAGLGI